MAEEKEDWLFPEAGQQRKDMEEKPLVFAQKYLVFGGPTADPRRAEMGGLVLWIRRAHRSKDFKRRDELMRRYDDLALSFYKPTSKRIL